MVISSWRVVSSSTETVEAMARALESVDNVQSTNGLPGKYISTGRRIIYRITVYHDQYRPRCLGGRPQGKT
jgi:hypothetical protein